MEPPRLWQNPELGPAKKKNLHQHASSISPGIEAKLGWYGCYGWYPIRNEVDSGSSRACFLVLQIKTSMISKRLLVRNGSLTLHPDVGECHRIWSWSRGNNPRWKSFVATDAQNLVTIYIGDQNHFRLLSLSNLSQVILVEYFLASKYDFRFVVAEPARHFVKKWDPTVHHCNSWVASPCSK